MAAQEIRFKGFVGQSYNLRNTAYDCQQVINWYPEVNETQLGKNAEIAQLVPTPGLFSAIDNVGGDTSRGGYVTSNGYCIWIFGKHLYLISADSGDKDSFTATLLYDDLVSGTNSAIFTDNGIECFFVLGTQAYAINMTTGALTVLTGGAFASGSSSCTFIDGYVVFSRPDTNQFFWTDLYTSSAPALNFASAESSPDQIVGIINNNLDLWIFGKWTTEIWYNYGQGNTVFQRRPNTLLETGCISANTIQKVNNTVVWMTIDPRGGPMVVTANGYAPNRISTYALEQEWAEFTSEELERAYAFTFQEGGHHMYAISFPAAETTWVLDMTVTNQLGNPTWHERQSFDGALQQGNWLAIGHAYYKGFHLTGDRYEPNLYIMDPDTYTDNGNPQFHERTSPHISSSMNRIRFNKLTVDFATGLIDDPEVNPQIMMQFSDDGGKTWSNEYWVSAGEMGQYGIEVMFQRLGMGRNRVFRLRVSDNLYWALSGASLSLEPCKH